jgi:hypothetical protein
MGTVADELIVVSNSSFVWRTTGWSSGPFVFRPGGQLDSQALPLGIRPIETTSGKIVGVLSSSFKAASAVTRIRDVVPERGEQERPEFTFEPVNAGQGPMFDHVQEKPCSPVSTSY